MARRRRNNSSSLWAKAPLILAVVALMSWGISQAFSLKRSIIDQAPRPAQLAAVDTQPYAQNLPVAVPDPTLNILPVAFDNTPSIEFLDPVPTITIELLPPDPFPGLSAQELIAKATSLFDSGQIVTARLALNTALARTAEPQSPDTPNLDRLADRLRRQLADLNASVFLGTAILPDDPAVHFIEIQSGDSFFKLGRQYAVPSSLLEMINPTLNPRNLRPLTGMKIVEGPFHLVFTKHSRRLDLYAKELYVRSYTVEIEPGSYLPKGEYQIAPGSKIQVNSRVWIGFQGIEQPAAGEAGTDLPFGWFYGSTGPRRSTNTREDFAGLKLADPDLRQLFNTLAESQSLLRIDP